MENHTFIIAEAGVNHNGDINLAYKLIDKAKLCGADAIKFQTFKAENIVSSHAPKANYQKQKKKVQETQLEMLKRLELPYPEFIELFEYAKKRNIQFLTSPFDLESIDFISEKINIDIFKIPSGEITNLPFLRRIGKLRKSVILSTGMSDIKEVEKALHILIDSGTLIDNISVLHCNTEYPTPFEDVNLKAMLTLKNTFGVKVGYSDHTLGIEIPVAAVSLGAEIIEKHFTLNNNLPGPDHKASLNPEEFKMMVKSIRNVEIALGTGVKKPSVSEKKNIPIVRKSIFAKVDIKKGETFTEDNLTVKRPGTGLSPMYWDEVLGKKSLKNIKKDELIKLK